MINQAVAARLEQGKNGGERGLHCVSEKGPAAQTRKRNQREGAWHERRARIDAVGGLVSPILTWSHPRALSAPAAAPGVMYPLPATSHARRAAAAPGPSGSAAIACARGAAGGRYRHSRTKAR